MIRSYSKADFAMIQEWWGDNESRPTCSDQLPDTTYVVEHDGKPAVSAALFLTNCKWACWIEMLVARPGLDPKVRRHLVDDMFKFLENEGRRRGFRSVVLFSYVDKLKDRYASLGYCPTLENVTTFAKLL